MSDHITQWLDAYLDGELRPLERQRVAQHLATCATCDTELRARQTLRTWIRTLPTDLPVTPSERFTAQVMLRLPPRQVTTVRASTALTWGLPLGLLTIWTILQVVWGVISWLRLGAQSGLLAGWLPDLFTGSTRNVWIALLAALGNTSPFPGLQIAVQWLQQIDHWVGEWLGVLTWQAQIALLYGIGLLLWGAHRYWRPPLTTEPTPHQID